MLRKNVASQFVHIAGINASTGAIVTGATWTMRRCLDGTFAAGGATVTEDGATGFYKVALTQADTNGNDIGYFFTATSCVPVTLNVVTTAADPTDSVRFGLTALPNAAAGANTGLPVVGTQVPNATAGAANGLFIAGSNAATTTAGFTFGAISATTITASGAVAFQSTFAVTTSTSLGALSATTITASGAVAFQSTFGVTGAVTFSSTFGTGAVTFNALTVTTTTTLTGNVSLGGTLGVTGTTTLAALTTSGTVTMNALTVSNATTLTGAITATNASNDIRGVLLQKTICAAMDELTGIPSATPTGAAALMLLFMGVRNLRTTTASDDTIANSAGATIATAALSDDTITFVKAKYA